MQLFSLFIIVSCFITFFIAFSSISLALSCFLTCLLFSQHVNLFYNFFYCFDVVGLAFLGQDMSKYLACAQIYMFMCFSPFLCLDLHVCVLLAMFMCLELCLDAVPSAFFIAIYLLFVPLLCVWLSGRVEIQIQQSKPTSIHPSLNKGFGIVLLCMLMLCLLFLMCLCSDPCLFAQIQVFAMSLFVSPLWVCACWSLGPLCLFGCIHPLWQLVWTQPCLGVHLRDVWLACHLPFSLLLSFACQGFSCWPLYMPLNIFTFPLCVITCFAPRMLASCRLVWLSLFLYIFIYMFMHVSLYSNIIELLTPKPNPNFSFQDTPLLLNNVFV